MLWIITLPVKSQLFFSHLKKVRDEISSLKITWLKMKKTKVCFAHDNYNYS